MKEKKPSVTYMTHSNIISPLIVSKKPQEQPTREAEKLNNNRSVFLFTENEMEDIETVRKTRRKSDV